jgi:hypothetical protein
MDSIARRVAKRFRDQRGPSKSTLMSRIVEHIREATGIGRGVAEGIAKALVRSGRDINQLAVMKGWPIDGDTLIGPRGSIQLDELRTLAFG